MLAFYDLALLSSFAQMSLRPLVDAVILSNMPYTYCVCVELFYLLVYSNICLCSFYSLLCQMWFIPVLFLFQLLRLLTGTSVSPIRDMLLPGGNIPSFSFPICFLAHLFIKTSPKLHRPNMSTELLGEEETFDPLLNIFWSLIAWNPAPQYMYSHSILTQETVGLVLLYQVDSNRWGLFLLNNGHEPNPFCQTFNALKSYSGGLEAPIQRDSFMPSISLMLFI